MWQSSQSLVKQQGEGARMQLADYFTLIPEGTPIMRGWQTGKAELIPKKGGDSRELQRPKATHTPS